MNTVTPSLNEPAKRPPLASRRNDFVPACKIAIVGFGTVGRAVGDILSRTPLPQLRLTHVLNRRVERKRVDWTPKSVNWTEDFEQVLASDADIVVELIGGVDPAKEWIEKSLLAGKSVVTANKRVMAEHGPELLALARQMGQRLEYGGSVAGGVPVLCGLQQGLAGDRVVRLSGVLNGTCNYILSNMEARGTSFSSALAKAQDLGFAEADPAEDIHGLDARCKLTILSRLAFHTQVQPQQIPSRSISGIEAVDFDLAKQLGYTIRQVSTAEVDGNVLRAAVRPALVPLKSPLAQTRDNENALIISGEHSGETLFAGRGAGGGPTAVAVVSDLVAIAENRLPIQVAFAHHSYELRSDFLLSHYLRLRSIDAPQVEAILRARQFAIRSITSDAANQAHVAIVLEPSSSSAVDDAVEAIRSTNSRLSLGPALPMF